MPDTKNLNKRNQHEKNKAVKTLETAVALWDLKEIVLGRCFVVYEKPQ